MKHGLIHNLILKSGNKNETATLNISKNLIRNSND